MGFELLLLSQTLPIFLRFRVWLWVLVVVGLTQADRRCPHRSQIMPTATTAAAAAAMELVVGQVETLLPKLVAAMEKVKSATAEVDRLKAQMIALIEEPQTVKTCWGSVTLNRGRRTVKVTDRALNAQITLLKESGIALGKCEESVGDPFITVRKSDR